MSDKDNKDFSLKDQINKRKTQEILRTIEQKRITRISGVVSTEDVKRATQTSASTAPRAAANTPNQPPRTNPTRLSQNTTLSTSARQTQQVPLVSGLTRSPLRLNPRQA